MVLCKKISLIIILGFVIIFTYPAYSQKNADTVCAEQLMESVSVLVSTNLFQTYLSITIMNDNIDNTENYEVFDSALFTLNKQLDNINEHLSKFNKSKYLKKEDFEYLFSLKEIIFDLKDDIKLFKTFLEKGDDDSYTKFYIKHTKVNKKIEELMELEGTDSNEVDVNE